MLFRSVLGPRFLRRSRWCGGLLLLLFLLLFLLLLLLNLITWWVGVLRNYRSLVMSCLGADRASTEVPACRGGGSSHLDVVAALSFGGISLGRIEVNGIRSPTWWWARLPRFGPHR